jgi:glycosyltransferase involved in cell wall biosynthesis
MRNILYISGTGDTSGGELSLLALMTHLDRKKFHPIVVCPFEGTFSRQLREVNIEVDIRPVDSLTLNERPGELALSFMGAMRRAIQSMTLLRKKKIALVHVNAYRVGISYSIAARLLGIPVVWHDRAFSLSPKRQRIKSLLADLLPHKVITVSEAVANAYGRRGRIPSKVIPIHNGIDADQYLRKVISGTFERQFNCADTRLIGNIGILTPWKGQDLFIEAAKQVTLAMPGVKFVLAGDVLSFAYKPFEDSVQYKQQLLDKVQKYDLADKVIFTGFLSDVPSLFSALDLYVHCAIRPDPLPRVILESMASKVPVVAPAEGGVPEMIEDGISGLLYPAGDIAAMTDAIVRLLKNDQERIMIGENGFARVREKFTIQNHAVAVQKIYQDLIDSSR